MADITIIDNYKSLMLGDYLDIVSVMKDETLEEIDKQVKVISILTGKDEEFILDLPVTEYQKLAVKLSFLQGDINTTAKRQANSYKVGGFDLVPVTDMRKVTTSQYIDFQSLHQAGFEEYFVHILSCILVPKGKKYCQDYDILEVQNAIRKDMSVFDGASVYAFFLLSCKTSTKAMLTYSLKMSKKVKDRAMRENIQNQIQAELNLLGNDGDGSRM